MGLTALLLPRLCQSSVRPPRPPPWGCCSGLQHHPLQQTHLPTVYEAQHKVSDSAAVAREQYAGGHPTHSPLRGSGPAPPQPPLTCQEACCCQQAKAQKQLSPLHGCVVREQRAKT